MAMSKTWCRRKHCLQEVSSLMVDKVTTVPRSKLGERIGRLADQDMVRLGRAEVVFFGLAGN
jgi:mRNA interferase MazF